MCLVLTSKLIKKSLCEESQGHMNIPYRKECGVMNSWGLTCLASANEQLYHLHLTNWTLSSPGDISLPLEELSSFPG